MADALATPGAKLRRSPFAVVRRAPTLIALVVLIVFNLVFTPHFISWQTLNVNLTQVATIVIVAVGMTLVIATGGIDLSVGSLMAISGALAPLIFMSEFGTEPCRASACCSPSRCRCWWRARSASSTAGSSPASASSRSSAR